MRSYFKYTASSWVGEAVGEWIRGFVAEVLDEVAGEVA